MDGLIFTKTLVMTYVDFWKFFLRYYDIWAYVREFLTIKEQYTFWQHYFGRKWLVWGSVCKNCLTRKTEKKGYINTLLCTVCTEEKSKSSYFHNLFSKADSTYHIESSILKNAKIVIKGSEHIKTLPKNLKYKRPVNRKNKTGDEKQLSITDTLKKTATVMKIKENEKPKKKIKIEKN